MELLEVTQEDMRLISTLLEDKDKHNRKIINTSIFQSEINRSANEHIQINMLLEKLNRLLPKEYHTKPYEAIWEHAKSKEITEAKRDGITINISIEKYIAEPKSYKDRQRMVEEIIKHGDMLINNFGFNVNVDGKRVCKAVL